MKQNHSRPSKKASVPSRTLKQRLKNANKLSNSSQKWLNRQLNDPYVAMAQKQGYRSRAAFKLLEIDDTFHLLKPNCTVVDLGCAPGSWLQVILKRLKSKPNENQIIGVDLLAIDPLEGTTILQGDFLDPEIFKKLESLVSNKVDLVLSDMASSTTGNASLDHLRTMALAEAAFSFSRKVLKEGGSFVAKFFQGGSEKEFYDLLKQHFSQTKYFKPAASRKNSVEMYVVALGYKNS
jgi:23S rRNA (uridine2552-2'-O)-methyltransferase